MVVNILFSLIFYIFEIFFNESHRFLTKCHQIHEKSEDICNTQMQNSLISRISKVIVRMINQ